MSSLYEERRENNYGIQVEFIGGNEKVFIKNTKDKKTFWKFHVFNKSIEYSKCSELNIAIEELLNQYGEEENTNFIENHKENAIVEIEKIYEEMGYKKKILILYQHFCFIIQ